MIGMLSLPPFLLCISTNKTLANLYYDNILILIQGEVVPPGGDWSKPAIEFISDAVVGVGVCQAMVTHRGHGHTFIRLYARDSREPLSQDMVQCGMAVSGKNSQLKIFSKLNFK